MIDVSVLQLLLLTVTGWLDRREREAMAYLIEENRLLRRQLGGRRLRLTDDDRRHQGLKNSLIGGAPTTGAGRVQRWSRLGGLLNYYRCAA